MVGPQLDRVIEERLELDLRIAQHVRIRRTAGCVLAQELGKHAVPVLGGEVDGFKLDADHVGRGGRVDQVLSRRAVLVVVIVLPVLHEQADDLVALLFQQPRRDRGVDPARHADNDAPLVHATTDGCAYTTLNG